MIQLTILRHGETDWNAIGRIQGQQQVPLNQRGMAQAQAAAEYLRNEQFDAIYSSDLIRALHSARPFSKIFGLPIIEEPALREWNLGILEGLLCTDAATLHPQANQIYRGRQPDALIPQAETIRQRYNRAIQCIEQIASQHSNQHLLIVTHGGILDDWYRHVNEIPLETERNWPLNNAGISRFTRQAEKWQTTHWSEIQHLESIGSMADW